MEEIIKVEPIEKLFSIEWMVGKRCNYDCMYCPAELHDNHSSWHSLNKMKNAWKLIYQKTNHVGLPYKITFSGGELTANKDFLPFLKWLRKSYKEIKVCMISSNGSAGLKNYLELSSYLESITFSTHSEFMDEKVFFEKAKRINKIMTRPKKSFHIAIMDEYWNKKRIKLYKEFCVKNMISYSVNVINYDFKTRNTLFSKGKSNL